MIYYFQILISSLHYYFFEVRGSIGFRVIYFIEKCLQYAVIVINGKAGWKIPFPFIFRKDYIIENNTGIFYIKAFSDFDYPIQPYVEDKHEMFWNLNDGDIFIDIGAHVGSYSIKLLKQNNGKNIKAYCFEPNPDTYLYLCKNIELNNLNNIIIPVNKGIYSENGVIGFTNYNSIDAAVSKIVIGDSENKISIEVITLDNFIKENGIDINLIGLIKVDVEGFEEFVFMGMNDYLNNSKKINIICEILDNNKKLLIEEIIFSKGLNIKSIDSFNYLIYSK